MWVQSARFDELFQPSWASDHLDYEGETLKLKLDSYSGRNATEESVSGFGLFDAFFVSDRMVLLLLLIFRRRFRLQEQVSVREGDYADQAC